MTNMIYDMTNDMNRIKHLLKLNMTQIPEDRLRRLVQDELDENDGNVTHSMRQVFKFLKWKVLNYPNNIPTNDINIIQAGNIEEFFNISSHTCKYTKTIINHYTEYLWNNKLKNELQQEGYNIIPKAKCTAIPIPLETNREEEVLIMSLFYPNNLLNSFTNRYNDQMFPNPMCGCGEEPQTSHHVLFRCKKIDETLRAESFDLFQQLAGDDAEIDSHLSLLKVCKNVKFLQNVTNIVKQQKPFLRKEIVL